jgi:hypothetical protein
MAPTGSHFLNILTFDIEDLFTMYIFLILINITNIYKGSPK